MIKRFVIYGLLGWCIEIFWTGMHSMFIGDSSLTGNSSLWMFFIYGLAVFLEPVHNKISHFKWYIRGLIWVVCIYGIELLSGMILQAVVGSAPWNYTNSLSFMGLIRFDYAPAWFIAGLLFETVHNTLDKYEIA